MNAVVVFRDPHREKKPRCGWCRKKVEKVFIWEERMQLLNGTPYFYRKHRLCESCCTKREAVQALKELT